MPRSVPLPSILRGCFMARTADIVSDNLTADSLFSGLSVVSEECDGINTDNAGAARPRHVRAFPWRLWQMIEVYLGGGRKSNWRVPLGLLIAEDIFDQITSTEQPAGPGWKSTVGPRPNSYEHTRRPD